MSITNEVFWVHEYECKLHVINYMLFANYAKLYNYSSGILFSFCMIGDKADAFYGLVQFWAVMPVVKRVAESVDALLCRELRRWWSGRCRWRTVDTACTS